MKPTDPVRELKRRTAAGEVAPLADPAGHGDWHRSFHDFPFFGADARAAAAARRQLRLRLKLGVDRRPCDPLLAAFRKRCVEHGGERDGLGALLAEDSLAAVILLLPDLRFEETLCALADDFGPIPENLFARSRTVGDLLSGLVPRTHAEAGARTLYGSDVSFGKYASVSNYDDLLYRGNGGEGFFTYWEPPRKER
jgi:hypothetical protein